MYYPFITSLDTPKAFITFGLIYFSGVDPRTALFGSSQLLSKRVSVQNTMIWYGNYKKMIKALEVWLNIFPTCL